MVDWSTNKQVRSLKFDRASCHGELQSASSLKSLLYRLSLWSAVYHIWHQKNALIMSEDGIKKIIQWEVKKRIGSLEKSGNSVKKHSSMLFMGHLYF